MPGVFRSWRTELVEAFPDLFHPPADNPGVAQAYPECGDGWHDLLERACVRIRAAAQADCGTVRFSQIKEKYATIRIYWDGNLSPDAAARVEEAIDLAEARSAVTCEVCGEEGRLRGGAWLTTRCPLHSEGRPTLERRSDLENVYLVQQFVDGRRFVTCRRYHRETDVFFDVDPASLRIEED